MSSHLTELAHVPALADHWVAIEPAGTSRRPSANDSHAGLAPLLRLPTGAAVVDADADLDALCARISAENKTSLTIVFNARR